MKKYIKIPIKNISEEEWQTIRQSGIGGSDIPAICNHGGYKTKYQIYREKLGIRIKSDYKDKFLLGKMHEETVKNWYIKVNSKHKILPNDYMYRSVDHDFAIANVDGVIVNQNNSCSVLEIKSVGGYNKRLWVKGPPLNTISQTNWYLGILGMKNAVIAALIGLFEVVFFDFKFDAGLYQFQLHEAENFWKDHVLAKKTPELSVTDNVVWDSVIEEKDYSTDENLKEYVETYLTAKTQRSEWQALENQSKNQILEILKGVEVGIIGEYRIENKIKNNKKYFRVVKGEEKWGNQLKNNGYIGL